jgi:hypothetical protein
MLGAAGVSLGWAVVTSGVGRGAGKPGTPVPADRGTMVQADAVATQTQRNSTRASWFGISLEIHSRLTASSLGLAPRRATPALPSRYRDDVRAWQGCCPAAQAWLHHSIGSGQGRRDHVLASQPGQPVLDGQSRASPASLKTSGRCAALAGSELLGCGRMPSLSCCQWVRKPERASSRQGRWSF